MRRNHLRRVEEVRWIGSEERELVPVLAQLVEEVLVLVVDVT
jgi:hypothetical protein